MTLDEIIKKYGTHELDIDLILKKENEIFIYAYCHQHDINGEFMINHYLEIIGKFKALNKQLEDENDMYFHLANITKIDDKTYEITDVLSDDKICFCVESNLQVNELTEDSYKNLIK